MRCNWPAGSHQRSGVAITLLLPSRRDFLEFFQSSRIRGDRLAAAGRYEQDDSALMSKQLWNVWPLTVTSDVILLKSNASCSLIADVDEPSAVLTTTTSSKE